MSHFYEIVILSLILIFGVLHFGKNKLSALVGARSGELLTPFGNFRKIASLLKLDKMTSILDFTLRSSRIIVLLNNIGDQIGVLRKGLWFGVTVDIGFDE